MLVAGLADDDRELGFVVDRRGEAVGDADRRFGRDHALRHLGEDHREFRHDLLLGRTRAAGAAVGKLGGMSAIVEADAEDVAPRHGDRRVELDGRPRAAPRRTAWAPLRLRPSSRRAPAHPRHGRDHRAQEASHRVRRRSRRPTCRPSRPPEGGDLQRFLPDRLRRWPRAGSCCYLVKPARIDRRTHETRVSRIVQRLGPGLQRVKEGHTCTNAQQTDPAAGQRRQGAHPAQALGRGHAAECAAAARPRSPRWR